MLSVIACLLLAAVLVVSAVLKLVDGADARASLATYGLRGGRVARVAWIALIAAELVLAVGVGAGLDAAAYAAAAVMAGFALAQGVVLATGRRGAPCACFGARGRVGGHSLVRTAVLACAFAALPLLPRDEPTTHQWLVLGVAAALLGLLVLTVVVVVLMREVRAVRETIAPLGVLEIPYEGPEVGAHNALVDWMEAPIDAGRFGLAVFTSKGCGICQELAPAVAALEGDPRVTAQTFDEIRDREAWTVANVPGSPFAVALDADGTVLAKGIFNTAAQLESVLATAARRRRGLRV